MPYPQTGQKGRDGLLQCPEILLVCFRVRISGVSPDNEEGGRRKADQGMPGVKIPRGHSQVAILRSPFAVGTFSSWQSMRSSIHPAALGQTTRFCLFFWKLLLQFHSCLATE